MGLLNGLPLIGELFDDITYDSLTGSPGGYIPFILDDEQIQNRRSKEYYTNKHYNLKPKPSCEREGGKTNEGPHIKHFINIDIEKIKKETARYNFYADLLFFLIIILLVLIVIIVPFWCCHTQI